MATTSQSNNISSEDNPSWLFSFGASNVGYSANKKKKITYIVDSKDVSVITSFTDRPDRLTGKTTMKWFTKNFKNMFGDDLPNASLTHWTDKQFYNGVFEIESIKKKKGKFFIKTNTLLDDHSSGAMAHDPILMEMAGLVESSEATNVIKQANFFIDAAFTCDCVGISNGTMTSCC